MKQKQPIIIVSAILLVSLILSACSEAGFGKPNPTPTSAPVQDQQSSGQDIVAEGHITPKESKNLSFPVAGRVAEVLAKRGDSVTEDQVIARLENSEAAKARLEAAVFEIENSQKAIDDLQRTSALAHAAAWSELVRANQAFVLAQKALDEIDTQQTQDDIDTARTDVANAEKELNDARKDFEPYKDLPENNDQRKSFQQAVDDKEKAYSDMVLKRDELIFGLDLARAELEKATQAQVEAQYRFDRTKDGPNPAELKLLELRLKSAQAEQSAAQAALDDLELKAPFAGVLMDLDLVGNELVSPADRVAVLADTSQWFVRTSDLTELEVVDVSVGQQVEIVPDALPGLTLQGTVEEISNTFTTKSGDILYEVLIRLDEIDPLLRWGMTVETSFFSK